MRTPLTLITGPLGSGKTTLVRKILADTRQKIAVIMNEFGEIAIDARVLKGKNVEIAELGGGCVCCSLIGEFEAALQEIIDRVHPDLIVVETTGLAEPEALILNLQGNLEKLVRLDGVIVLADADATLRFPQLGYVSKMQLEAADIVLINKLDLVDAAQLQQVEQKVRKANPTATLFHTVRSELDTRLLFGPAAEQALGERRPAVVSAPTQPEPHAHEQFESFSFTTTAILDQQKFTELADHLPQEIYRAKGLVRTNSGSYHFNFVAGRWDWETTPVSVSEFVFIGVDANRVKSDIMARLEACAMD